MILIEKYRHSKGQVTYDIFKGVSFASISCNSIIACSIKIINTTRTSCISTFIHLMITSTNKDTNAYFQRLCDVYQIELSRYINVSADWIAHNKIWLITV